MWSWSSIFANLLEIYIYIEIIYESRKFQNYIWVAAADTLNIYIISLICSWYKCYTVSSLKILIMIHSTIIFFIYANIPLILVESSINLMASNITFVCAVALYNNRYFKYDFQINFWMKLITVNARNQIRNNTVRPFPLKI